MKSKWAGDDADSRYSVSNTKHYVIDAETAIVERIPEYKYNEGNLLAEIKQYIDDTYGEHYATDSYQATDVIIDNGWGEGFCLGNILKYCKRYGKKDGYNRKDLLKIIHYAIISLYIHDREHDK